jgi:hypothetical protein
MLKNLAQQFKVGICAIPQTLTADVNCTSVDTQLLQNLGFIVAFGSFTFTTTNKVGLKLQHSDDNSTFADCDTATDYFGGLKECNAVADASTTHLVQYRGTKRYVRLVLDVSGTVSVTASVVFGSIDPIIQPPL